jgi:hypothetical protein
MCLVHLRLFSSVAADARLVPRVADEMQQHAGSLTSPERLNFREEPA